MSISCKDLVESYKGFNVKAVTKDKNERITVWNINDVVYGKDSWGLLSCNPSAFLFSELGNLEITEFVGKEAKDCIYVVEDKVDYEKWKNCLVWAWDEAGDYKILGILTGYKTYGASYTFDVTRFPEAGAPVRFNNCRPVSRDEVEFVED